MSLPAKLSLFDPNVYTINGNLGVRNITQERGRKKQCFCLSLVTYMRGCSGRNNEMNSYFAFPGASVKLGIKED